MTYKQRIGKYFIKHLPVSRHVFNHFRLELNAIWVRFQHKINPWYVLKVARLRKKKNLLVNVGCGPFGKASGWINLDLYPIRHVYIQTDCRKKLILANDSCKGILVEMFLEHLDPVDELPFFLKECYRSLEPGGILRIIVPDASKFIHAYYSDGWEKMNKISYGEDDWSKEFSCKMEALNHVFLQEYEHYGGWDYQRALIELKKAGFQDIVRVGYNLGRFPQIIDREFHKANGLYVEGVK